MLKVKMRNRSVGPRRVGAGVAGLPLPHEDIKQKKIKPPNRNPRFSLVRCPREKGTTTLKVKMRNGFVGRHRVEAEVAGPAVDRELEDLPVHQETGPVTHREPTKGFRRKINQEPLSRPEKILLRQKILLLRLHLLLPRRIRRENRLKIGNPWRMCLDCMRSSPRIHFLLIPGSEVSGESIKI